MCEAYTVYIGMPFGDQDKSWTPHVTYTTGKNTGRIVQREKESYEF